MEGDYSPLVFKKYENDKYACLQGGRMCSQATRSAPPAVARIVLTMLRLARCCRYFPEEKFCHPRDNLSATPQMYKIRGSGAKEVCQESLFHLLSLFLLATAVAHGVASRRCQLGTIEKLGWELA